MKKNVLNIISKIIYVVYAVVIGYLFVIRDFKSVFLGALSLIGILLLVRLNKKYDKLFNSSLVSVLIVFIMIAILFGTCLNFYDINHFDDFLHICSGFMGCAVAYVLFDYFSESDVSTLKRRIFFTVYMFMFSMGVSSIWELIEFFMDKFLGFDCQAGGLVDTMTDILDCFIGTTIMSVYYYFKTKNENLA